MKTISKVPRLLPLPDELHKGSAGRVLCIGGSKGLSGSIILSARAAIRTGAGLVTLAVPNRIGDIAESASLETMTIYCASKAGHLIKNSWADIIQNAMKTDVILIGPGIGRHQDIKFLLQKTIALQKPTVIDADALHVFASSKIKAKQTLVLTPHIGEMTVLTGAEIPGNHTKRKEIAAKYALENNLILVLKSHRTIVTDGKQMYEETAGNPGMATGGSGDVLAGTIASFLLMPDQPPFINTIRAVHTHSLSGDLAAKRNSKRYLIASDIIENYGSILSLLEKK